MMNYESSNGSFPYGAMAVSYGTWYHSILNYIEGANLANAYNFQRLEQCDPRDRLELLRIGRRAPDESRTLGSISFSCLLERTSNDAPLAGVVSMNYGANYGNTGTGYWQVDGDHQRCHRPVPRCTRSPGSQRRRARLPRSGQPRIPTGTATTCKLSNIYGRDQQHAAGRRGDPGTGQRLGAFRGATPTLRGFIQYGSSSGILDAPDAELAAPR